MTDEQLEILLGEKCKVLDLKQEAFDTLKEIFFENAEDNDFLRGFEPGEIKTVFDGFEYHVDKRHYGAIIRVRIGIYIENVAWLDNIEPIGYYVLETNFNGEVLDDWLVIEKEKYLKDVGIISHFQSMNQKLPLEYLKRSHIQYEFVTYISFVGTLFISKEFEGTGRFVVRAYMYLEKTDNTLLDKDYIKESMRFLKMMKNYLVKNDLVTDKLKQELIMIGDIQ